MRQELLWIDEGKDVGATALRCDPVEYTGKAPKYVWTLFRETDKERKPTLPISPAHHFNAFLEDRMHDWDIRKGQFYYYSRVSEGKVWLLLEFDDE